MRAYSASSEEARRARDLLKDWAGEGFLTAAQYQRMEQETVCDLRRTNIFLRLVLFFFTLIIVGAAVGLFFVVSHAVSAQTTGYFPADLRWLSPMLPPNSPCPALGSIATGSRKRWPPARSAFSAWEWRLRCSATRFSSCGNRLEFLVPAAGAIFSLWIWHRFGLPYASLAAMIFVVWLAGYWTSSHSAQHLIVAAFYAAGLIAVVAVRARHRFTYLNERVFDRRSAPLARHLPCDQPPAFVAEPARSMGGPHSSHHRILERVLLDHLGADLVLAAHRARARLAPERPLGHRSGHHRRHPDPGHQQALSRLAAAHLGPDAAGRIVDRCRALHPTLARRWAG